MPESHKTGKNLMYLRDMRKANVAQNLLRHKIGEVDRMVRQGLGTTFGLGTLFNESLVGSFKLMCSLIQSVVSKGYPDYDLETEFRVCV